MPIPTSRTNEIARITIDAEKCNGCGHCMALCPKGAIKIEGRFTSPDDLFPLPDKSGMASYDALLKLFQRRRSIREFKDKPVEQELIDKIIAAASTADGITTFRCEHPGNQLERKSISVLQRLL